MEIIVRYKSRGYKTSRNILHEGSKDIVYKRSYDLFKFPQHLAYRLIGSNLFLRNSHYSLLNSDNSIWHLFNGISWNTYPWITTFETSLPRWGNIPEWLYNKGIKQLAKNNCKKIIAMSCCAAQIQEAFLKEYSPAYKEVIVEKLEVLHPPQAPLIASYKEKNLNNIRIEFTLIGADFFRKGGTEILKVFDQLLKNDSPVKLNIISSLSYGDYASHTSVEDLERAKKIINKHEHIMYHERLPNNEVLKLLKNTHIGLLPTYADTYGFSVLEAQATGCPVITTDIRALPEINNQHCGWIIDIPKYESKKYNEIGRAKFSNEKGRKAITQAIEEQLTNIIIDIVNNPDVIEEKGKNSLQRIKQNHDPDNHAHKLRYIYQHALL